MKRLLWIGLFSILLTQCSYIERQRLQIPQALATKSNRLEIHFPMLTPRPEHAMVGKPNHYAVTLMDPQSHQETTFRVRWTVDDRLDVIPAFLKDIPSGESQNVHGFVVHKVAVQTDPNTTYVISFAVSKTGNQSTHDNGVTEETIFRRIFPAKIALLKNGQPIGHITVREIGISSLHADVIWNQRVWDVTFQSIMNQSRFLVSTPHGSLAFFKLKPAKQIVSTADMGEAFFDPQTPDSDMTMAVLSYIYAYALFQANSME